MKLIYIEANAEEIRENKTLADAIGEVVNGFCDALIDFKPVLKAKYSFKEGDPEE